MENTKNMEGNLEIARENFKKWNNLLKTGDPKKVADLYSDGATFLPTLSPKFKFGQEETEGYFEHFLQKHPSGKVTEEKVQFTDQSHYLHSGLYDFEVDDKTARSIVQARFTFLWGKDEKGEWKILHHHSSVLPK
ncbi:SgcJ/EcaC family oxidoreductase [Patescibacteria group bacterium]|nr:SgcJ/EcaC family oxidoreductase [Patescibacteria group bacterium]